MSFPLLKFKLSFADGTEEAIDSVSLWLAWFKGKVRAAEKRTVLLKVEEVKPRRARPKRILTYASSLEGQPCLYSSPPLVTIYFDMPTVDEAVELETFLHMVSEGKARIHLVDRVNWRVRVDAEFLEKVY